MDAPTEQAPTEQAPSSEREQEQIAVATNDSTRTPKELFRYSDWVHVGAGAEDCPQGTTGDCTDRAHFHAWCRMPNQIQHNDIRERALAAKARRIRQLRDPDTDAHVILESDIAELRRDRSVMIDEAIARDWWKRHLDAMNDVEEEERFEHAERDRDRFRELQLLPEDKRPADEYAELERHLEAYAKAVDARRIELEQPIRDSLEHLDDDELAQQVREDRTAALASQAFMDTYSKWQWFAGTFTTSDPAARKRRFQTIEELEDQEPEVLDELRRVFAELEASLQRGPRGN